MTDTPRALASCFAGQRLLVTGASGFLGGHLCSRLVTAGAHVDAVSRVHRASTDKHVRWWQVDLENLDATRSLVSEVKPHAIVHLGGLVNGAPERNLVIPTFHSLVTTTVNLLEMAADTGCRRVLLVGSLEEPTGSAREVCPTSPYGAAKWAASAYGRMFHRVFGLPVVIARTYMTYGPGQPTWKVIPSTILSLLNGQPPRLSSGRRALDWIYVDDVVDGLLLAASTPGIDGSTIDLGSGRLTPIRDVVTRLVGLMAPEVRPMFHALPDRPGRRERAANMSHTRTTVGWVPTTSLDDGLTRTVAWYRDGYLTTERKSP